MYAMKLGIFKLNKYSSIKKKIVLISAEDDWQPCMVACYTITKGTLELSPGGLYFPDGTPCSSTQHRMFCASRRCRVFDEHLRSFARIEDITPRSCKSCRQCQTDLR